MEREDYSPKEITIKNIPSDSHATLKAISKNLGIPMGSIIKSKLPDIINLYPQSMRVPKPDL